MDGLEHRRLLPRYQAWLKTHPPKKISLIEKLFALFKETSKPENIKIHSYVIPKDILKIIVSYLPTSARQNWRLVSHYWHDYVDVHTTQWKELELRIIEKELPPIIKSIFGGSSFVQSLPAFEFRNCDSMERFDSNFNFRLRYQINFLKPHHLNHAISQGIAPDGTFFFCFVVRNITLNNAVIMTIHETSDGWTISVSPWSYDYYSPFSEDITVNKEKQTVVVDPEFESAMKRLIQGRRIRRAIGNMVQVMCEFELSEPSKVPNWNWHNY